MRTIRISKAGLKWVAVVMLCLSPLVVSSMSNPASAASGHVEHSKPRPTVTVTKAVHPRVTVTKTRIIRPPAVTVTKTETTTATVTVAPPSLNVSLYKACVQPDTQILVVGYNLTFGGAFLQDKGYVQLVQRNYGVGWQDLPSVSGGEGIRRVAAIDYGQTQKGGAVRVVYDDDTVRVYSDTKVPDKCAVA